MNYPRSDYVMQSQSDTFPYTETFKERVGHRQSSHEDLVAQARIKAVFYPKFENEKSDQEIRSKMIDMVDSGRGVLEVSLKHSGSLFMYAGDGGAFAKNSFGNLYTAVGVFVLAKTFQEAWGSRSAEKQKEFSTYLGTHRLCVSMELVTAVLGDHGQRPHHDYVVVTAVTDLSWKPQFYSTPQIIAFCRRWRLPTNHVWIFSSRKSVVSFFTAYDALCEEGTASVVSRILNEISDVSVKATKEHTDVQGEILEGLVARIVVPQSAEILQKVLVDFPLHHYQDQVQSGSLRELFAEHGDDEQKINALLQSIGQDICKDFSDWKSSQSDSSFIKTFLKATPMDQITTKIQDVIRLLQTQKMKVRYPSRLGVDIEGRNCFRLTIHVLNDFVFRKYENEMRANPGLWPLYRGFFVDVTLFTGNLEPSHATRFSDNQNNIYIGPRQDDYLADNSENLMLKLKFLPYKIRTFLICNGLSILFHRGISKYREYYCRLMRNWSTSIEKQRQLDGLLYEWAKYITGRYKGKGLNEAIYLSEAEPFLETFAKRSPLNQTLVGLAETTTTENVSYEFETDKRISDLESSKVLYALQEKGMIVFFPVIPGFGKSSLCKELLKNPATFADGRRIHTLMGDCVKGRYWPFLAKKRRNESSMTITLADKNAPNVEVWEMIETMCERTVAVGVSVVPASEGSESNPFSLELLALFMYRVLQRDGHPGNLDKASPNLGYILLMFYNLYEGKDRSRFKQQLKERFGYLVELPVLKENRPTMPSSVWRVLEHGIALFREHTEKHGKLESNKGSFKEEWSIWEEGLRRVLNDHSEYFHAIQVPFEETLECLQRELLAIIKGNTPMQKSSDTKRFHSSVSYAALCFTGKEIFDILQKAALLNKEVEEYFHGRETENIQKTSPHVTLADKFLHGVAAVAAYGELHGTRVGVELVALVFTNDICALEVHIPDNTQGIISKNEWPHITVWRGKGTKAKEANHLPQDVLQGKASRVTFEQPIDISGVVKLL